MKDSDAVTLPEQGPTPPELLATLPPDSRPPAPRSAPSLGPASDTLARTLVGEARPGAAPPGSRDLRLGSVLAQRYRIEQLLGTGGCGAVYRARHLSLGADVAIKFLLAEWANRPVFRERFRREALALSRLVHPCIVTVHDFGEDAGDLFLVMEYVRGSTLASHIGPDKPLLLPARIARILDQLLTVLALAHQNHIVHRDLKPANVMLVGEGPGEGIKVLDFGMAHVDGADADAERLTQSGVIFGTLQYMSPEHCRGRGIGPLSDIYSVGVMLYEMLSGDLPFTSQSPAELMTQHLFVSPPPITPRAVGASVPPELPELIELALWALAKQPEKRPTAKQLREVLQQVMSQTDAGSALRRLHRERIATVGLSRAERALTVERRVGAGDAAELERAAAGAEGETAEVALCGFGDEARAQVAALEGALGANRLRAVRWPEKGAPPAAAASEARALVLAHGPDVVKALRALRSDPASARLPVLVIDVPRTAMPALISAGASDLALVGTEAGELCRRLWRLIERGR
jgi:serine/threonine-protein kinase